MIMILLNLDEMELKKYRHQLSKITFDFNMKHDIDIKPIAKARNYFYNGRSLIRFIKMLVEKG